jgi:hypothetical protein
MTTFGFVLVALEGGWNDCAEVMSAVATSGRKAIFDKRCIKSSTS